MPTPDRIDLPEAALPDLEPIRALAIAAALDETERDCTEDDCEFLRVNLAIVNLIDEARRGVEAKWRRGRA